MRDTRRAVRADSPAAPGSACPAGLPAGPSQAGRGRGGEPPGPVITLMYYSAPERRGHLISWRGLWAAEKVGPGVTVAASSLPQQQPWEGEGGGVLTPCLVLLCQKRPHVPGGCPRRPAGSLGSFPDQEQERSPCPGAQRAGAGRTGDWDGPPLLLRSGLQPWGTDHYLGSDEGLES